MTKLQGRHGDDSKQRFKDGLGRVLFLNHGYHIILKKITNIHQDGRRWMRLFLIFWLILICGTLNAQFNSPLGRDIHLSVEKDMNASGEVFFSSWRPYLQEHITKATSTALAWNPPSCEGQSWWKRKFFEENLLIRRDSGYMIFLDPVFDFAYGRESTTNRNLYVNTRGVRAGARLGKHFALETDFYENQSVVPVQVDAFAEHWRVMPGQGGVRRYKDTGWDYANASGYISWTPVKSQNVQFGHGKHFVGDGYRSLLLSDNSFNYPYVKYTATFGRWQYVRTVASFMNIVPRKEDRYEYPKKTAGFNYATVTIGKRLYVSLFEGNIWQDPDSTGRFKPKFGIFNPVMLTNTLFTGDRTDVHSLLGMNVKYLIMNNIEMYGQLVFDDIMNTFRKSGVQLGAKYFDALGVQGLFLQAEFNQVAAGTYSFSSNTSISYVHYNQAIAHPLGDNFNELVAFASYQYQRFRFEYRFNFAKEKQTNTSPPTEFLVYEYGKKVIFNHIQASWVMNPRNTMQITAGYTDRNETSLVGRLHTGVFFIAFRTALRNAYYDF